MSKRHFLDFEQPVAELESKIDELRYVQNESAVDISEEIDRLDSQLNAKGMALLPLKIYFTKSFAKVLLGVGKGKNVADKRETIKRKEADRETQRAIADRMKNRG